MTLDNEKSIKILIVEDDVNLGYLLEENLTDNGFEIIIATNGRNALSALRNNNFDLCLIDIMLPEADGFEVADHIRCNFSTIPFIFLTARAREIDKLKGFELGADDYIVKPFSFKELHLRIKVILRRQYRTVVPETISKEILYYGITKLDPDKRLLEINGQMRKISNRENELLTILFLNKGKYLTRSEILKNVWGRDDYFTAKSMDVFLTRLRKLLKDDQTLEIENLYGTGYRIKVTKP